MQPWNLEIQCVAYVVRHGRLGWFRHLERKSWDDWVSSCRNEEVAQVWTGWHRGGQGQEDGESM